jgi:hypothetical protein
MLADTCGHNDAQQPNSHTDTITDVGGRFAGSLSQGARLGEVDERFDEYRAHEL